MTVLVTGSKGMIGSKLLQGLLDAGYRVVGVDRIGEEEVHTEQLTQLTVDLADTDALQKVVDEQNVDRIICALNPGNHPENRQLGMTSK